MSESHEEETFKALYCIYRKKSTHTWTRIEVDLHNCNPCCSRVICIRVFPLRATFLYLCPVTLSPCSILPLDRSAPADPGARRNYYSHARFPSAPNSRGRARFLLVFHSQDVAQGLAHSIFMCICHTCHLKHSTQPVMLFSVS